jgi:hypothetical protein
LLSGADAGFTVSAYVAVETPSVFLAVIVYVTTVAAVVGVPDIKPVLVSNASPGVVEIFGEIEYPVTTPPVELIV